MNRNQRRNYWTNRKLIWPIVTVRRRKKKDRLYTFRHIRWKENKKNSSYLQIRMLLPYKRYTENDRKKMLAALFHTKRNWKKKNTFINIERYFDAPLLKQLKSYEGKIQKEKTYLFMLTSCIRKLDSTGSWSGEENLMQGSRGSATDRQLRDTEK